MKASKRSEDTDEADEKICDRFGGSSFAEESSPIHKGGQGDRHDASSKLCRSHRNRRMTAAKIAHLANKTSSSSETAPTGSEFEGPIELSNSVMDSKRLPDVGGGESTSILSRR